MDKLRLASRFITAGITSIITDPPVWSSLNRWGKSRLLQTSFIWLFVVPFAANLLGKIGREIEIPLGFKTITFTIALPFSWVLFFYAAVFFSMANFIYSFKCPPIVRDYNHFPDFANEGRNQRHLQQFSKSLPLNFQEEYSSAANEAIQKEKQLRGSTSFSREEELNTRFWFLRDISDTAYKPWRTICALAYLLGFILTSIVALQNVISVIKLTDSNFFVLSLMGFFTLFLISTLYVFLKLKVNKIKS